MRRTMARFGLLVASTLLAGCGGGGIEAGIPKDADTTKASDPMAGVQMLPNPSPKRAFVDPMRPNDPPRTATPKKK